MKITSDVAVIPLAMLTEHNTNLRDARRTIRYMSDNIKSLEATKVRLLIEVARLKGIIEASQITPPTESDE